MKKRRCGGQVVVYLSLFMVAFLIVCALVTDIGFLYYRRAQAQKAADLSALAGASCLPDETAARAVALEYAARNGYPHGVNGVIVETQVNPDGQHPNWFLVRVSRPEPFFFGAVLGLFNRRISAAAIAEYQTAVGIDVYGMGQYGVLGPVNLSVFGPYAYYSYGDAFSTRWLDNGNPNPLYDPRGYDFAILVPENYSAINGTNMVMVEIFDPDCYNSSAGGGDPNNANGTTRVDEIRNPPPSLPNSPSTVYTTTVYTLYWTNGTPRDLSDDVLISQISYGYNSSTDMKWVAPSGFTFSVNTYGPGMYRLNVRTIEGSSENGFLIRAGPPRSGNQSFNPNNGTKIIAVGRIPINFNTSGTVDIRLGHVPASAAGGKLFIDKFDTDVAAVSVTYRCDTLAGSWSGRLAGNGQWERDVINLPANYTGGTWTARYQAGVQDTSVWMMYYSRINEGMPGTIRLVE
ncbi:MAG: pilus assembly protein TadG-related protein [Armatimonadetes bacterium]|nr:pilus assembly protein TadG-related protein [Armatimonadota bacterium]MDW8029235.1 pilus assembly protein TadG-related protein [Armatimonadota bacterium]